ncbi:MAG: hypothetical protein QOG77_213, partial [Solirubrobacteraceae bacterium]|nr:hypothetical protein [Solirubrobacteraceae bacterium]
MRVLALIVALVLAGAAPALAGEPVRSYETRPDLRPVAVQVLKSEPGVAPGSIFLAPKRGPGQGGPLIVGDDGEPIWFLPLAGGERATDFRMQRYQGRNVLTWWQGIANGGRGEGVGIIADEHYRIIEKVRTGNGVRADLHEFTITPRGTALLISYHDRRRDLSAWGGRKRGKVVDGVVQEVDIATGKVLFQWRAMGAIRLEESYDDAPRGRAAWDFVHLNSVAQDENGDFLVSARHAHAVYKISRATGKVVWRLGGKRSSFEMGAGTSFALQHDARFEPDGTIRVFDNSSRRLRERSRVLWLRLDETAGTATLEKERHHPARVLAGTQANAQELPNGNLLVGWGSQGRISEFNAGGTLLLDLNLPIGWDTYRAYREAWAGRPLTAPKLVAETRSDGGTTAYMSWNGATGVAGWQLLAGDSAASLQPVAFVPRRGFET